ncbi:hypothetical protein [Chitinophaga sp.]|uniref:hypothetical protein n=1 Tax=Chitinophaga sp. TaxID=1869181 RepID=UPI0031D6FF51
MKVQKKDLGTQAINFRLAVCKVCITACFAIALSLFLFACGSSKDTSNADSTATAVQADTSLSSPVDTAASSVDSSSSARPDSTPRH